MFSQLPDEIIKHIMTFHSNTPFQKQELLEVMKSRPKYIYDIKDGALHSFERQYEESFVDEMIGNGGYETYIRYTLQSTFNDGSFMDNINEISEMYIESWLNPIFVFNNKEEFIKYIKTHILRTDYNSIRKQLNYKNPLIKLHIHELKILLRFYIYNYY